MQQYRRIGRQLFDKQVAGRAPQDVTELHFTRCALDADALARLSGFENVASLSLVAMMPALDTAALAAILDRVPRQRLRVLDVCDNKIGALPAGGDGFPALERLVMCNNAVRALSDLHLAPERFPRLRALDLQDNAPAAAEAATAAWALLPSLRVVNGHDRSGAEAFEASDADDDDDGADEGEEGDVESFVADDDDDAPRDGNAPDADRAGAGDGPQRQLPERRQREE
jgi:hypothetical protein